MSGSSDSNMVACGCHLSKCTVIKGNAVFKKSLDSRMTAIKNVKIEKKRHWS